MKRTRLVQPCPYNISFPQFSCLGVRCHYENISSGRQGKVLTISVLFRKAVVSGTPCLIKTNSLRPQTQPRVKRGGVGSIDLQRLLQHGLQMACHRAFADNQRGAGLLSGLK